MVLSQIYSLVSGPEALFASEEIKSVVLICSGDKAPGPDGFAVAFFNVLEHGAPRYVYICSKTFSGMPTLCIVSMPL